MVYETTWLDGDCRNNVMQRDDGSQATDLEDVRLEWIERP